MPFGIALNAFRSQEAAVRGAHECHVMSLRASAKPLMPHQSWKTRPAIPAESHCLTCGLRWRTSILP